MPIIPEIERCHHPEPGVWVDHTNLIYVVLCQTDGVDIAGSGYHDYKHYRIGKDVVARLEFITAKETKARAVQPDFYHTLSQYRTLIS